MSRFCSGLLLTVGTLIGTGWHDSVRAAEIPDEFLPPMIRPMARITTEIGSDDPDFPRHWRYGRFAALGSFTADGKYLAAPDIRGGTLQLWSVRAGKAVRSFGYAREIAAVAFTPDGKTLLTTDGEHRNAGVRLWDVETGKLLRQLDEGVNQTPFFAAAYSPDGKTLALAGVSRAGGLTLVLWDAASGDELRPLAPVAVGPVVNRRQQRPILLESLAFSPDGRCLAGIVDRRIVLWELSTGKIRSQLGALPASHSSEDGPGVLACLAFSRDGRVIAAGCADETIRLFDVLTGRDLPPLTGHRGNVRALCFLPDGKTLQSLGSDGKVLLWSTARALRPWQPKVAKYPAEVLEAFWDNLASDDPWLIHAIQAHLASVPAQAIPFLRERLKPVPVGDAERIGKLVGDLENEDYNTRKKAVVELRKLGQQALPALIQAAERGNSDAARQLVLRLDVERRLAGPAREVLAVDVLARIGGGEARGVLASLAKGAADMPLTVRAQAALERLDKQESLPSGAIKPDALWADLGSDDAPVAFRALKTLTARPNEAVPLLRDRLRALPLLKIADDDPRRLEKLVAELDSDDFSVREKATEELKRLAGRAEKALRQRLKADASADLVKRIEELLTEIAKPTPSRDAYLLDRGLETLERIGTDEARAAIQELAKNASSGSAQEQIRTSLRRLGMAARDEKR